MEPDAKLKPFPEGRSEKSPEEKLRPRMAMRVEAGLLFSALLLRTNHKSGLQLSCVGCTDRMIVPEA